MRTTIVTGAARGIGAAIAVQLARGGGLDPGRPRRPAGGHRARRSFLASDGAGFVSGQVIFVAGGPVD